MKKIDMAKACGAHFEVYNKTSDGDHFSGWVMGHDQLEKFAQLVIVEHEDKLKIKELNNGN